MHPTIAPGALECHPVGVHYGDDTSHPLAIDAAKCHITVLASQRLSALDQLASSLHKEREGGSDGHRPPGEGLRCSTPLCGK